MYQCVVLAITPLKLQYLPELGTKYYKAIQHIFMFLFLYMKIGQ